MSQETQCVDTTKQVIVNMEANVLKHTTAIFAKIKSVEVIPAQTDIPGPANILKILAMADTKITVPMYTLVAKTIKKKIFYKNRIKKC